MSANQKLAGFLISRSPSNKNDSPVNRVYTGLSGYFGDEVIMCSHFKCTLTFIGHGSNRDSIYQTKHYQFLYIFLKFFCQIMVF